MQRFIKSVGALLLAAASVLTLVPPAQAAQGLADVDTARYGGADRYATSLLIAEAVAAEAGGTLDAVVMVSGRSWTDAVVAAPLAGSLGAAVLATPSGELRTDAARFLQRSEVSRAVIIGADSDTDGVGPTVVDKLEMLGISVERVTRPDQYATSVAVARRLNPPGIMKGHGHTAIVASGEVFADALVAGAFAARGRHPILLTKPHVLRGDVARYLTDTGVDHVVLMGGTAALHEEIEESITALGIEVTRLAGATRYATAVAAAELAKRRYSPSCFTDRRVGLARAHVPFDSFSAAPLLARLCAPLLLADPGRIPPSTAAYLSETRAEIAPSSSNTLDVRVFGGSAAISGTAIADYLASESPQGATCDIKVGDDPIVPFGGRDASYPAWSPDCERFAYVSGDKIWTARIDGSRRTRLTEGSDPTWSPDGELIAFTRASGRRIEGNRPVVHVHVIRPDGTGDRQLTDATSTDAKPSWSPDSQRLVFERQNLSDSSPAGSHLGDAYLVVIDKSGRNETDLRLGWPDESQPHWTLDGDRISFKSVGLHTVRDDGSDEKPVWPVIHYELDHDESFREHAWSPDGCSIALVTGRVLDGGKHKIAIKVINLEDSAITTVVSYTGPENGHTVIRTPR